MSDDPRGPPGLAADAAREPRYAGFWLRVAASLIDTVWMTLMAGLIVSAVYGPAALEAAGAGTGTGAAVLQMLLYAGVVVGFWAYRSATPGKMVFHAVIVDARTLGRPGTGQLIARYLGYYLSAVVLMLGFLWVAFDARKQGWHDKLAGTVVIIRET